MHALVFGLGAGRYAVATQHAREVVAAPTITVLPTAPGTVLGVFNLRGEIVPVFDPLLLLGQSPLETIQFVVVIETPLGPAGLAVSSLDDATTLGDPVGDADLPGTVGAFAVGRRVVVLLDVEALLAPARVAV